MAKAGVALIWLGLIINTVSKHGLLMFLFCSKGEVCYGLPTFVVPHALRGLAFEQSRLDGAINAFTGSTTRRCSK